jgi:hypothetical protein
MSVLVFAILCVYVMLINQAYSFSGVILAKQELSGASIPTSVKRHYRAYRFAVGTHCLRRGFPFEVV